MGDKEKSKEGATSTILKSKENESSISKVTPQSNNHDSSCCSSKQCFKCLGRGHTIVECPN